MHLSLSHLMSLRHVNIHIHSKLTFYFQINLQIGLKFLLCYQINNTYGFHRAKLKVTPAINTGELPCL